MAHQLVSSHADTMANGFLEAYMAFKQVKCTTETILEDIARWRSRETAVNLDRYRVFDLFHTVATKAMLLVSLYFESKKVSHFNQAQGSMKERKRRDSLPAIMRSSCKTSDYSDSWGFGCNSTSDVSLKARDHSTNNRANMQKASSWITVLTCPWWWLSSNYRQSLERKPAIVRSCSKTSDYSDSWGFSSNSTSDVSLKARDHSTNNRANMQKASSWITVLTFSWWLLHANYRQSLEWKPAIMRRSSYYSNSRRFSSNSTSDVSLKAREHSTNNRANMQKASSWITVLTFPWCLLQSNYRQSLCNEQRSLSIWHALLEMINFTAFLSSLFLMAICGAHFTRLQISVLLISSAMIVMDAYVSVLGLSN